MDLQQTLSYLKPLQLVAPPPSLFKHFCPSKLENLGNQYLLLFVYGVVMVIERCLLQSAIVFAVSDCNSQGCTPNVLSICSMYEIFIHFLLL